MPLVLNSSSISGLAPVGGLSSPQTGSVLQVVQGTSTDATTTSTSFVTTGLSASITPTSSSSKILIFVTISDPYNASVAQTGTFTVYRGATNIAPSGSGAAKAFGFYWTNSSGPYQHSLSFNYLDSPATTSATTYTVYFATAGGTLYTAINGTTNIITLMEIAA
jgi:hypothetical protein